MLTLELFRPQQRVEQIDQHDQRHYESDDIFDFHDYLLQTIAAADIRACNYKKHHGDEDKYNVKHLIAPKSRVLPETFRNSSASRSDCEIISFSKEGKLPAGCNLQERSGRHLQIASSSEWRLLGNSKDCTQFRGFFQSAVGRLACAGWHVSCVFTKTAGFELTRSIRSVSLLSADVEIPSLNARLDAANHV